MKTIEEIINENRGRVSAKGGEKNFIIATEFLPILNTARMAQNGRNYRLALKNSPMLTKEEYKRGKAYLRPLTHGRIGAILKGKTLHETKILLSECKQAPNFSALFWWKVKQWKLQQKSS